MRTGAVVEVKLKPITEAEDVVPVAKEAQLKFLMVFAVIVLVPAEETMPRITLDAVIKLDGTAALFKFEIVLFEIIIVPEPELFIPFTSWYTVVEFIGFAAFILFVVDALPI